VPDVDAAAASRISDASTTRIPNCSARRAAVATRIGAEHVRARSLQHRRRQHADRPETQDHDRLFDPRAGIERDLQRGLHQREQRGHASVHALHRHHVGSGHREQVLVGVEGEDRSIPRRARQGTDRSTSPTQL
jgi:hypothetical protein